MHCSTLQANCCSMLLCKASRHLSTPTELASIRICSLHKCGQQAPMQCSTILQELPLTHVCNHQAPMHCSTLQVNCCSVLLCKASCQHSSPTELASIKICSSHKCGQQAPMQCSTILQELLLTHVCNHQAPMHCSTLQVNCCSVLLCKASCQHSSPTELASIKICSSHKCGHQTPMQCSTTHRKLLLSQVCHH